MNTLQSLFPSSSNSAIVGINHDQITQALSKVLAKDGFAILHVQYPHEDERNHKSLDTLVAALSGHGFVETASLISEQAHYLLTNNLAKAMRVYHEIQRDSVAISVTLHFDGLMGLAAEEAVLKIITPADE